MSRPPRVIVPLSRRRRSATLDWRALSTALGIILILLTAVVTCAATYRSILTQRAETEARLQSSLTSQAHTLSEEIDRQILAVDQTLLGLARKWEADPTSFKLRERTAELPVLGGLTHDMVLVDETGTVRQSTVPEAVGQNVAARDFVAYARRHATPKGGVFVGGATLDPIMRQWHLNIAIWLHHADGSFAGALAADYRVSALLEVFHQAVVGKDGLVALIGLSDGRVRANLSTTEVDQNTDYAGSPMLSAMKASAEGNWIGRSATDSVDRFHAYRRLPGPDLVLIVAMERTEAMLPATEWQWQAARFAGAIIILLLIIGWQLLRSADLARIRAQTAATDHATLAATNAQLQVAKAEADAKAEHLAATLGGMTDGIYMMDAQFCLVEWNERFPDLAGIPADLPRVGLPMEEILRAQANTGLFGPVDIEAEVERRMTILRTLRFGTTERTRPDGRTIELRRRALPDGGFVTLYSDITEHKRVEADLRDARSNAETANAAKTRFVAIVSHEIRTPLNALLNTLRLLEDSVLTQAQRGLVAMASQSGDALSSLVNDILEMSRMEAGQLVLRPSEFELRTMLRGALDIFRTQAEARGILLHLDVAADVPPNVLLDGGRLRQVLLNLLSNAVKFARAGDVVLAVARDYSTRATAGGLRITVSDQGPTIPAADRERLFQPFSQLDRPDGDTTIGSGLGLSICLHLITMMGGAIGCEPWSDGQDGGNTFWVTLPDTVIVLPHPAPAQAGPMPARSDAAVDLPRRLTPRTRILLVEDVRANQVIAATLLRRVGHSVDIAGNGAQAIRAVQRIPYDVVLMDIFMPGMSGQETTRHIRELPDIAGRVPILALTANTAPEDEVLYVAAGMNGALGKPVSLPELQAALTRYVWPGHPAGGLTTIVAAAPDPDALESILALERLAELRTNLPADVLMNLVDSCLAELDEKMPPFRRALAAGIASEIEPQAHAIAGIAASYGLAAVETKARAIMVAAKAGNIRDLETAFPDIETALARSGSALREIVQNQPA